MGFKFRKSIKLGGGLRLNVGKKGVGVSAGGKGFRVSVGPRGTRISAGIPGTGLSYSKTLNGTSRKRRIADQRRRELANIQQEQIRMEEHQLARYEVEVFENQIEVLTSVHKDCSEIMKWDQIRSSSPPFVAGNRGPNEEEALAELERFKPTIRDRIFNRIEIRKKPLLEKIERAKVEDQKLLVEWTKLVSYADKVMSGDEETYIKVINKFAPFDEIEELGSSVRVHVVDPTILEAIVDIHSNDVIPPVQKSLTKTGKLSVKDMTKTRFNELYQDYVCSCAIRISRELFALLPINLVYVQIMGEVLNKANGLFEKGPILSVVFDRRTLSQLNFERIDCSDSMSNFQHSMNFKKIKGFEFIKPLVPKEE